MVTNVYRVPVQEPPGPRWLPPRARFWVRLLRLLPWTLARRRQEWREDCRWVEAIVREQDEAGTSRVTIRADNGSVVKNVYVNRPRPRLSFVQVAWADIYRRHGHVRMPRT